MAPNERRYAFTITELAVIAAIIAIFIVILAPFIKNIRSNAKMIACEENLQKISLGLKLYASEHEGRFPSGLMELSEGGYVEDERVFNCPSTAEVGDALEADYHYVTGHDISSFSNTMMVYDKSGNHKDKRHVLYLSGEIVCEKK